MLQFRKHKWLGVFLDLVLEDLKNVKWQNMTLDNLAPIERRAQRELQNAERLVIKKSDKGGNVVFLSEEMYKKEVRRPLADGHLYKQN